MRDGRDVCRATFDRALLIERPGEARARHQRLLESSGFGVVHTSDRIDEGVDTAGADADIVFVDASLERAVTLARSSFWGAALVPPIVAMILSNSVHRVFDLAQAGFADCVSLPLEPTSVATCLDRVRLRVAPPSPTIASLIGTMNLKDAQRELRYEMLRHALVATNGSRRSAARLLGVTRPAVQRMLREDEEGLSDT